MNIKGKEVASIAKMLDKNPVKESKKVNKDEKRRDESLSFNYVQNLMKHDYFKRHRGAIKQVGWANEEDA